MSLFKRIKQIMAANINHAIDKAEDPEKMIKQLIREMDESIIQLRMEVAKAIATEKRLSRRIDDAKKGSENWQKNAQKAVSDGDDELARKALARKLREDNRLKELNQQHEKAKTISETMKEQLRQLENKIQEARRKKEILIARKRSASAQKEMLKTAQKISDASGQADSYLSKASADGTATMDSLEDKIVDMEAEAEALHEMMESEPSLEQTFDKAKEEAEVERMLDELKKQKGNKE